MRTRTNSINGRFRTPSDSSCNCTDTQDIPVKLSRNLFTDRVVSNNTNLFTNKVQPLNGIIEEVLGYGKGGTITTIGISMDTATIAKIGIVIVGAGLLIKNLKL